MQLVWWWKALLFLFGREVVERAPLRRRMTVVEEGDKCICTSSRRMNQTEALACAESPLRPWQNLKEARCRLWCCAEALAVSLKWMPLLKWHETHFSRGKDALEPILGMHTLVPWTDGKLVRASRNSQGYIAQVAPVLAPRDALVLSLALSSTSKTNVSAALFAAQTAALQHKRHRLLIIAYGDAPFPVVDIPDNMEIWATNLLPQHTQDEGIHPFPIGISAGPSSRWVHTILTHLEEAPSRKKELMLCSGYRLDTERRKQLSKLTSAGFTGCGTGPKLRAQQYWKRLLFAKTVFCPRGLGVSTFRTYEAILAQTVPIIIQYPPHADLFQDLPVITLSQNLTSPDHLKARYDEIQRRMYSFDLKRAFAPFWFAKLARASIDALASV